MSTMAGRAHGAKYIYQDTSPSATYEYGFMQVRFVSLVLTLGNARKG